MTRFISAAALAAAVATASLFAAGPAAAQKKPVAVFKVPVQAANLHPDVTGVFVLCRLLDGANKTQFRGQKRMKKPASGTVNTTVEVAIQPNSKGKLSTVKSYVCLLGVFDKAGKPFVPGDKKAPAWAGVKPGAKRVVSVKGPYTP